MTSPSVALVLLVKNELEPMKVIIPKIDLSSVDDVFCMDGQSTDGSVEFLEEQGIRVVTQKVMGRGNAVTESLGHSDADYLLYYSPDGNEDPRDIPKLIKRMKETRAVLVIARRFGPYAQSDDSDDPYYVRKIGNLVYSVLVRIFWGGKVWDAINGFRLVNSKALKTIRQNVSGHQIEIQQTIRFSKMGIQIEEIPTIEAIRVGGMRKAPTYKMGLQFFLLIVKELVLGLKFLSTEKSNISSSG
ncbi:MAG: glycosyltransferase [Candidatus Thorarchaeota archaeon]